VVDALWPDFLEHCAEALAVENFPSYHLDFLKHLLEIAKLVSVPRQHHNFLALFKEVFRQI